MHLIGLKKHCPYIVVIVLTFVISFSAKADSKEVITVATGEYPPWTSKSLPYHGYINRIVKEAFALSDIKVEFVYLPWKRALEATRIGQYNASSFWGENKERVNDFIHSALIDNIYFVFFYQSKHFNTKFEWQYLQDLKNLKIGATRGYTYSAEFWELLNNNNLRVSLGNSDIQGLRKLVRGNIDVFPISEFTGKYLLSKHFSAEQASHIEINRRPLQTGKNFILFSKEIKENERYAKLFNKNLETLKALKKLEEYKKELF